MTRSLVRLKVEYIDVASSKKGCLACQPSGNFLAQLFSVGAVHFCVFFFCKSECTCLIGLFVTFLLLPLPLPHAPIVYLVGRPDTRPTTQIRIPNPTMNPWLSSERVCWQVGVSVCGFSSAHHQPQQEKFPGGCRAGLN